ncbi:TIGR00295 family protein [Methanocaldococcus infernus]|uniref:Metal dependent phosphohydrolase n=1 Tax=Methanocaldococcus infernus (strain DSM 11812 / JCM 15783 / ME) TaxID=573063 RepID=D5VQY8_METIM|nr:TIGR00295 family protein [Methanocaldococcus infernus]ADG12991.1 metal dependent phosphohydrolase [Methanocaldococcus infernus ME]
MKPLKLLKSLCSEDVVKHCLSVSNYAYELALRIKNNGHDVDVKLVKLGALLHDIGRSKSHKIDHGVIGGEILRKYGFDEELCLIAERHIGAGITREEALKFGLPYKDFVPTTLEEKIVAHADNLIFGTKRVPLSKVLDKFRSRGAEEEVIKRIVKLDEEIINLLRE